MLLSRVSYDETAFELVGAVEKLEVVNAWSLKSARS